MKRPTITAGIEFLLVLSMTWGLGGQVVSVAAHPRTLQFSGYEWTVRTSAAPTAPGGNTFSDSADDVWVDGAGFLHLTLGSDATEVRLHRALGYGTYEVRIDGRLDRLDPQAVFGFFTFELPSAHPHHREIDIEFSRWGQVTMPNAQFSVQPSADPTNRHRFELRQEGSATTHRFVWTPERVGFVSWHGHGAYPPPPDLEIARYTVSGEVVPQAGGAHLYFNFWRYQGAPLQHARRQEVVLRSFRFEADGEVPGSTSPR